MERFGVKRVEEDAFRGVLGGKNEHKVTMFREIEANMELSHGKDNRHVMAEKIELDYAPVEVVLENIVVPDPVGGIGFLPKQKRLLSLK